MDHFIFGNNREAQNLVLTYHYSHRIIPSPICVCTQYRNNEAIAAVFFSSPPARWKEPVVELSRLVRKEEVYPKPILTQLISKSIKELKRLEIDLLISYADSTHDHFGGIYQAASWHFHKKRKKSCDGWIINNEFIPRRTCYAKWSTSGRKLKKILAAENKICTKHYDTGKYLYWKALNKNGIAKAKRLNLESNPYPRSE